MFCEEISEHVVSGTEHAYTSPFLMRRSTVCL